MRKSVIWIPVLLVGALVYWTLALGFGGLSLMTVTFFQDGPDPADSVLAPSAAGDTYQSITVNLNGSAEGQAEQANGGSTDSESVPVRVELVPDHESKRGDESGQGARGGFRRSDQGPGETAF